MSHRFAMPREFYVPKGALKVADKQSDAVAYLYNRQDGRPVALVFYGKQSKPVWHWNFRTVEAREARVREAFADRRRVAEYKAKRREERKAPVNFKVGDIFRTCWGYDQTNVEFYEIVELKGKHAILRELATERSGDGWTGKCVPLPGQYKKDEPLRRLCQQGGFKISSCQWASPAEFQTVAGVRVIRPADFSTYA